MCEKPALAAHYRRIPGVSHETPPQHAFCDNAKTPGCQGRRVRQPAREGRELGKFPIHTIGALVCFGQVTCSSFLLGHCARNGVAVSWLTENGRFMASMHGPTTGNVLLRREQYRKTDSTEGRFLWPAPSSPVRLSIAARCCGERPENIPRTTPTAAWPESAKVSHPVCNVCPRRVRLKKSVA